MKKLVLFLLALALCFSACKGKETASGSGVQGEVKKYTSLPLVSDGKTTITMYVAGATDNVVTSYAPQDNLFTAKIIKETGINLDIISETSGTTDQLAVLLNSGNYPEVINKGLTYDNMLYYAGQGIFKALDDYDPLGYPQIKAAWDEYPTLDLITRGLDGKLYALPEINDCMHCIYSGGRIWYYMPWLRDNNLKEPQTLDEFTEYLRYVKANDLNKNGKRDEIAIAFDKDNANNFIAFIAKAFMPFVTNPYYGLAMDNGKIVEQYKAPEFREALKYLAAIYKEGLILPDSFTMSVDQMKGLAESPDPVVAVEGVSWLNGFVAWPSVRFMENNVLPALQGPTGQRNASNIHSWSIMVPKYFITDKAKDPALAIALYNYLIEFSVAVDGYMGPKGVAWTDADPGTLSILGTPASHKYLMSFGNTPVNISWSQGNPMIRNSQFRLGEQATGIEVLQKWYETGDPSILQEAIAAPVSSGEGPWYLTSVKLSKYAMPESVFPPPMSLDDDDNARVSDITAVLDPYKSQAFAEFVTGARNINSDADWNTYLAELDQMGAAEMVQIRQKYIN
ncbi:MAG: extracellular solute-binding protein [Treponema sp.]|nr:extracellular solute-binding protein [Treponema sp.]